MCSCFPERRIHLYGTPGQQRFDFMWDVLGKGMDGIIILINNDQQAPHQALAKFLQTFPPVPTVIGVTKMDLTPEPTVGSYRRELETLTSRKIPVFNVDTRIRRDVTLLLEQLIRILPSQPL